MTNKSEVSEGQMSEYVTALIAGQLFGLPISRVQDVFMPDRLTRVPLSSREIAGVLNLRGRIVTVIDMRARLGLPKAEDRSKPPMAVGVDLRGESYGLLIDQIGEVLRLPEEGREENPVNLDPRMAKARRRRAPTRWSAHGRARRRPGARPHARGNGGLA
jgi:purine-binding chemotaxis protein CheW